MSMSGVPSAICPATVPANGKNAMSSATEVGVSSTAKHFCEHCEANVDSILFLRRIQATTHLRFWPFGPKHSKAVRTNLAKPSPQDAATVIRFGCERSPRQEALAQCEALSIVRGILLEGVKKARRLE